MDFLQGRHFLGARPRLEERAVEVVQDHNGKRGHARVRDETTGLAVHAVVGCQRLHLGFEERRVTCKCVYPGINMSTSLSALSTMTRIKPFNPSSTAFISSSSHSRISVATWSFRERPVWSLPPRGPMSSLNRLSLAVWISSSSSLMSN